MKAGILVIVFIATLGIIAFAKFVQLRGEILHGISDLIGIYLPALAVAIVTTIIAAFVLRHKRFAAL